MFATLFSGGLVFQHCLMTAFLASGSIEVKENANWNLVRVSQHFVAFVMYLETSEKINKGTLIWDRFAT